MAPNLLTIIGFVHLVVPVIAIMYFDNSLTGIVPNELFYILGVGQFIYQTLDAVDGKQARKTKSSSPLGQLFDHGCDAFGTTFVFYSVIQCLRPNPYLAMLLVMTAQIVFSLFKLRFSSVEIGQKTTLIFF